MGHYFLPGHGSAGRTCKSENIDSGSRAVPLQEAVANSFASELLLRTTEVEVVVRKRLASIETAKHLASIFDTSLTAALLKTVEVTNERCCVVMSKDGRIEWARPNDTFRHYVPRREKLDHETLR